MELEVKQKLHKGQYENQKIDGYTTQIGVLDADNATSCYLTFGGYVRPNDNIDLNQAMKGFKLHLRKHVDSATAQLLSTIINTNMPVIRNVDYSDTSTSTNGARVNNIYTYFSIELTIFFNQPINIRDQEMKDLLSLVLFSLSDFVGECRELSFSPARIK